MDVIQRIHQSCELIQIVACGGSCLAGFKIEYFNGRPAGSKVYAMLREVQVIFPITAEQNYTLGGLGRLGYNQVSGEKNSGSLPVHLGPLCFKHTNGLFQAGFISYSCFLQN